MTDQLNGNLTSALGSIGIENSEGAVFWVLTGLLMGFALVMLLLLKSGRKRAMADELAENFHTNGDNHLSKR